MPLLSFRQAKTLVRAGNHYEELFQPCQSLFDAAHCFGDVFV